MRLVLLTYSLGGGGAERVAAVLAGEWVREGHEVTIATLAADPACAYALDPRVAIEPLGTGKQSKGPLGALTNLIRSIRILRRFMRTRQPDAIIGMMHSSAILLGLAGRVGRIRRIGSERVYPPAHPIPSFWHWLRPRAYGQLDVLVMQTGLGAQWAREHTRAPRVEVIGNPWREPADAKPVVAVRDVLPAGAPFVFSAGRLVGQKRFDLLIDAFADVAGQFLEWHLVIAGSGELENELRCQVERLGLESRVHMPGRIGNMKQWYDATDLFVLASDYEGFPNALLEAMGAGKAVIASDCPSGPAELVDDRRNGLMFPPGDRTALSAALRFCLGDTGQRREFGNEAKKVRQLFETGAIARRWLDVATGDEAGT